jgi:hypothetical protein
MVEQSLSDRAKNIAYDLMDVASSFREEQGEEVQQMFGFLIDNTVQLVPGAVFPAANKDHLAAIVQSIAEEKGAKCVFMVSEAWLSMNPLSGAPSKDPARMEIIMITASGEGVNLMMTRQILGPKTLGEVEIQEGSAVSGRFHNLSGREGMN